MIVPLRRTEFIPFMPHPPLDHFPLRRTEFIPFMPHPPLDHFPLRRTEFIPFVPHPPLDHFPYVTQPLRSTTCPRCADHTDQHLRRRSGRSQESKARSGSDRGHQDLLTRVSSDRVARSVLHSQTENPKVETNSNNRNSRQTLSGRQNRSQEYSHRSAFRFPFLPSSLAPFLPSSLLPFLPCSLQPAWRQANQRDLDLRLAERFTSGETSLPFATSAGLRQHSW